MTARSSSPEPSVELPVGQLAAWFDEHGRDLPWRRTREPWTILVSELMLQQTQVARVVDRLPRFLDRFPTPSACAAAPAGDVIDEWAGLGYNRRALALHRAAGAMVADHGGDVPSELAALLALPGIGPYTARAVRVFAFERPDGVVDTNIARVLARVVGRPLTASVAQRLADRLVPDGDPWTWNQALMEVGALRCRPTPRCDDCPLRTACGWARSGLPDPDPAERTAGVTSPQSTFEGSDRQGRGRLVDALRRGPVEAADLAATMGWSDDPARAARVAETVVGDGLAVVEHGTYRLP